MFDMIGLLISLLILGCLSVLLGCIFAAGGWLLLWGRRRPWLLIMAAASIPPLSACYLILCAICFTLFVPNQPNVFFGDISEPLPNGYILKCMGKMSDYCSFDSTDGKPQPPTLSTVGRLELDGQVVYGAYSYFGDKSSEPAIGDQGYFAFDTRSGDVRNFDTLQKLNAYAGHPVHLVETYLFRSQDPGRKFLRRVENAIYFGPPAAATLLCLFVLVRFRLKGEAEIKR